MVVRPCHAPEGPRLVLAVGKMDVIDLANIMIPQIGLV
jgi:hypothetical protein